MRGSILVAEYAASGWRRLWSREWGFRLYAIRGVRFYFESDALDEPAQMPSNLPLVASRLL